MSGGADTTASPASNHIPERRVDSDRRAGPALPPLAGYRQLKVWRSFIDRWLERLNGADFDIELWLMRLDGTLTGVLPSSGREWWDR